MTGDAVAVGTAPRQVRASTEAERPDTTLGPRVSRPGVRRMRLPAAVRLPQRCATSLRFLLRLSTSLGVIASAFARAA